MSTLHERISAAVEKRLAVAQAATPGPWEAYGDCVAAPIDQCNCAGGYDGLPHERGCGMEPIVYNTRETDTAFIAANDPARIIRDCRRDLKVLERHNREPAFLSAWVCRRCRPILRGPCVEIRDLAEAYEIGVGDGDG